MIQSKCAALLAEMPELGMISYRKFAALAGLAPYARDRGTKKGKRRIVAFNHNPSLRAFAQRQKDKGKPHKVVIIAVARKLLVIAYAMIRDGT